ncbi:uncharacterized protein LOC114295465 [Camellia sinensis]|uniref:uncharacterized protein LOC114295465 n=1 Tax=Camellia sinensis TaxID=4442 RepID=UPI00103590AE|nr:uncharacterized protein LOC114295465 [Camellia sinensis]
MSSIAGAETTNLGDSFTISMIGDTPTADFSNLIVDASEPPRLVCKFEQASSTVLNRIVSPDLIPLSLWSWGQIRVPLSLAQPVKKKLRRVHPDWALKNKEEVTKQIEAGFLLVSKYPTWLANIVPVLKKDGRIRVCVDFKDLDKASPKDDFPLLYIDELLDFTAGHALLLFMDGFSRYN